MKGFTELQAGVEVSRAFEITAEAIDAYARLTGDGNPLHMDASYARRAGFRGRVAHGMYLAGLLSRMIGEDVPGHGALWFSQDLVFEEPAYVGDRVTFTVRVQRVSQATRTATIEVTATDQHGIVKLRGKGQVMMPEIKQDRKIGQRIALVTGGSGGIGSAICETLGRAHFNVLVGYGHNAGRAEDVARRIAEGGGQAEAVRVNLAEAGEGKDPFGDLLRVHGCIDTVVCCAVQEWRRKPFAELATDDWMSDFRVAVLGHARLLQALLPGMAASRFGRVIGIASSVVLGIPPAQQASYVVAKHAMVGLFKALLAEYSGGGMTFNLVSPSFVDTNLTKDLPERMRKVMMQQSPLRRLCKPDDVASVVELLAREDSYINGVNIPVAGGLHA